MSTNMIGFAGTECHDLMLYAGKTLAALGQKVLLADCSDTRALQNCIPSVEGWNNTFVHYDSLDFTLDLDEMPEGYDWIIIDFGKKVRQFSDDCQRIYLVTNYQKQNIEWVKNCTFPEDMNLYLILRDRISSKISPNYVMEEVSQACIDGLINISDTSEDLEAQMMCQYNSKFGFRRVSQSIRDFIVHFLQEYYEPKEIMKAIKTARGK